MAAGSGRADGAAGVVFFGRAGAAAATTGRGDGAATAGRAGAVATTVRAGEAATAVRAGAEVPDGADLAGVLLALALALGGVLRAAGGVAAGLAAAAGFSITIGGT